MIMNSMNTKIILSESEKREYVTKCDPAFQDGILHREEIVSKILKYAVFIGGMNEEGEKIGYCAVYANDVKNKTAYITMIGVLERGKGKHLGSALMNTCIDECRRRDMDRIRLEVFKSNHEAIRFYKHKGFTFER